MLCPENNAVNHISAQFPINFDDQVKTRRVEVYQHFKEDYSSQSPSREPQTPSKNIPSTS
jgi:hypothetical protein